VSRAAVTERSSPLLLLEIDDVSKPCDATTALLDASLRVSAGEALSRGTVLIPQELAYVRDLTVAENTERALTMGEAVVEGLGADPASA
jgi:hypothetical protein